jgi:hypothetical protein
MANDESLDTDQVEDGLMFCSSVTSGEWTKAVNDSDSSTNDLDKLHRNLSEILRTEHLNVLAGAGASMGVWKKNEDPDDEDPAEPTRKGLWKRAEQIWDGEMGALLKLVKYDEKCGEDIEALLSQCHLSQMFSSTNEVAEFAKDMESAIVEACRFVEAGSDLTTHELFLRKAARRSRRLPRLKIFTTNYDLCFERAARNSRFVVVDGFSHTLPQEFDSSYFAYDLVRRTGSDESPDYIPNVFHLYKLHGSVDWCRTNGQVLRCVEPKKPLLIYPRSTKFETSYEPPFIEMMGHFQSALRAPNTAVIVAGYGFADNHLTQPILSAVRSNVALRLVVVDPALTGNNPPEATEWLMDLIKAGDSRICLVSATLDDFVRLLPDPDVKTEEELHLERLRKLRK